MNGYRRALATLRRETTDSVATWAGWIVSDKFFEYVTGKYFWDNPRRVAFEAYRKLEVDIVLQTLFLPASPDEYREFTDDSVVAQDKFQNPEAIVQYIDTLLKPEQIEKEFNWEEQVKAHRQEYEKFQNELGNEIFAMPKCKCARFIWYLNFGYENYLQAMALYPDAITKLYRCNATEMRLLNQVRVELVKQKVMPPYFFCGHDICGQTGPIASPQMLRNLYFPWLKYSLEPLVQIGAEIVWHCDGYIPPILNDLAEAGVSGFQGFQEETGFDIKYVAQQKVRNGKTPLLWAGLSVARTLPKGTVEQVKQEVKRIIDSVASNGGLAIGTANTAGPDCPSENLEAMYKYVHEYHSHAF